MCGIAGLCNWKGDIQKNIHQMNERMFHRGPDAGGSFIENDGSVALGHRRLSIVDLSPNGAQPMESHSKRFVMAFNGEIYNHRELRDKLVKEGILGNPITDTIDIAKDTGNFFKAVKTQSTHNFPSCFLPFYYTHTHVKYQAFSRNR